jgi:ferric-dicitrate binding protein FerR (iron transport regulator)
LYYLSNIQQFQSGIDVEQAWDSLNKRLSETNRNPKVISMAVFMRIAVSVLALLTIGLGSLWINREFLSNQSATISFEAPKGEKSKIILADGSLVWLNSETILKYDALSPRKVTINGEAYFEIKKDKEHPFEVSTASGMKVKVTGTKFNLRSFSNETFVETTLEEGEVIIENTEYSSLAVLKPGQQAKYNIHDEHVSVQNVSTQIYSIWKNNELRFQDVSFFELAPQIERWYGVSIKLDSTVSPNDRFTMTIKTESLRELLKMMQLTSKFDYEINGEQISIHAK